MSFERQVDRIDPITLEIWWSRLVAIADETASTLVRTCFSTIIRESNDYTVVLLSRAAEVIAECRSGVPGFAAIMGVLARHVLSRYPLDSWKEGDCVITNHPWLATGHLPDIALLTPIFHRGVLVGFTATAAHVPDIGGSPSLGAAELITEGLLIPPVRLYRGGKRNEALLDLLAHNVRLPEQVRGDIEAQVAANEVCRRRAGEFLEESGQGDFEALGVAVQEKAERAMRRAIAALPDGVYRSSVEADGVEGQATRIQCAITVSAESICVDYQGSSPQVTHGINCVIIHHRLYGVSAEDASGSVYAAQCRLVQADNRHGGAGIDCQPEVSCSGHCQASDGASAVLRALPGIGAGAAGPGDSRQRRLSGAASAILGAHGGEQGVRTPAVCERRHGSDRGCRWPVDDRVSHQHGQRQRGGDGVDRAAAVFEKGAQGGLRRRRSAPWWAGPGHRGTEPRPHFRQSRAVGRP